MTRSSNLKALWISLAVGVLLAMLILGFSVRMKAFQRSLIPPSTSINDAELLNDRITAVIVHSAGRPAYIYLIEADAKLNIKEEVGVLFSISEDKTCLVNWGKGTIIRKFDAGKNVDGDEDGYHYDPAEIGEFTLDRLVVDPVPDEVVLANGSHLYLILELDNGWVTASEIKHR